MSAVSEKQLDVAVKVMGFDELCGQSYPLKLDHYQRPYVWTRQKIEQMLSDLSLFSSGKEKYDYYLGTLLLHRDDEQKARFVIDGQQRLSTLAVIYHDLANELPKGLDFHYRSPLSAANLRQAQQVISDTKPLRFGLSLFGRLRFTVITVTSEDLAFTFFDTQNNRGVPLKATDLLKAYHLRAINNGDGAQVEQLQKLCARRWEAVQVAGSQKKGNPEKGKRDYAPELFHHYLWRARNWCGQRRIERENHDRVLETFQHQSIAADAINSVSLYPGHGNQFANRLCLLDNDDFRLDLNPVQVSASAAGLPFSLRQPIHQGVGFFLYAQKYAVLLDELLHQTPATEEVSSVREFYSQVVEANSHYLRELFNLALLMYVDRFGYMRLLEFAQRVELVLGAIRIEKSYIFKEAPLKYLREADHNLLDVIASAYRPDEVMAFLQGELAQSKGYGDNYIQAITPGNGVRGRYLAAMQSYYDELTKLPSETPPYLRSLVLRSNGEGHNV